MQTERLASLLKEAYAQAPERDKSLAVCMFGIRYAEEIGKATNEIVEAANIGKYGPEVRKGIKLARFVTLK